MMNGNGTGASRVSNTRKRGRRTTGKRAGFTLIEMAISVSILLIGIVSVVSATSKMHNLRKHTRERTLALNAMRSVAERLHATSNRLSNESVDWVGDLSGIYGPGGTFGNTFPARGLTPVQGQNAVGNIQLVTDETTTDAALQFQVGMPRDLNGDGDADDNDVSLDARLLPVLLTLTWRGVNGPTTVRQGFYVTGY